MNKILYLGPKPPPVTGYANVVVEIYNCLVTRNLKPTFISTVPNLLAGLYPGILWRVVRAAYLLALIPVVVVLTPFHRIVYLNVNGEIGLLFDVVCAGVARLFGKRIYLHHQSFQYLYNRSPLVAWLVVAAGTEACHVMNGLPAKERLMLLYPGAKTVRAISNAPILSYLNPDKFQARVHASCDANATAGDDGKGQPRELVFGYMAYFNADKGLDTFCETVRRLRESNIPARGVAVGPVHDAALVDSLEKEFADIVDFRGPAYGEAFDKFFEEIDVLLFPSRYRNESEPLTIYHAFGAGVPVFSTQVGCIKSILAELDLCDSAPEKEFVEGAVRYVSAHGEKLRDKAARREAVQRSYSKLSQWWAEEWRSFLQELSE